MNTTLNHHTLGESQKIFAHTNYTTDSTLKIHYKTLSIIMLGEEFRGKSCYAIFFKLKNKIMLGEFHVS